MTLLAKVTEFKKRFSSTLCYFRIELAGNTISCPALSYHYQHNTTWLVHCLEVYDEVPQISSVPLTT